MNDEEKMAWKELVEAVVSTIRGYKSHWQETITNVERDELLESVAIHVSKIMEERRSKLEDGYLGSITEWGQGRNKR